MQRHIELAGLLFMLAGALSALAATSVFILGLGALGVVWSDGPRMSASVAAATFLIVAALLALWAGANAWVGRQLRHGHRPFARLVALALAVLHLFVLPFGTALGIYTLWVLLHHESRTRFEGPGPFGHPA